MQPTEPIVTSNAAPDVAKKHINMSVAILTLTTIVFAGLAVLFGISYFGVKAGQSNQTDLSSVADGEGDSDGTSDKSMADAYEIFSSNLSKNYYGGTFGEYYHYTGTENVKRSVSAYVDENNHLKVTDTNNGQVFAEADEIISVYYIELGDGGVPYFYMIDRTGHLARINISEYSTRRIEKVEGYNNIVAIMQGGDLYAWLIDIDGNIYKHGDLSVSIQDGVFVIKDGQGTEVARDDTMNLSEIVSCDRIDSGIKCTAITMGGESVWFVYGHEGLKSGYSDVKE